MSDARAFAIAAHGDQKYGNHPYADHLDEVAGLLRAHGHEDFSGQEAAGKPGGREAAAGKSGNNDFADAGYLHDVLEDTDVTFEELERLFGRDVANAVAFCSDEPGPDRKTRKAATYARMAKQVDAAPPWIAMAIATKVADRLANVSACIRDDNAELLAKYKSEWPTFRAAAHRRGLCDSLWAELDRLL